MEAAWITKNYGDHLYLQCTYTCIRVLDRRLAHASKSDKVVIGDFIAKIGPRRISEERHIGTHGLEWSEHEDAVVDTIYEEYDWLIELLHVSAMKTDISKVTKRRLSPEALVLIRQRGTA
uniref:DUF4288 domain-containing protein n=1 Tax=Angiostrongylus cantonensis TaxID=6313 RepID=A0A0K0DGA0_ANGCA